MIDASSHASAHSSDPTTNTPKPASYIRTRPNMSPSRPTWVASSVMTSRKLILTQITADRAMCRLRCISGRARTTMVVSTARRWPARSAAVPPWPRPQRRPSSAPGGSHLLSLTNCGFSSTSDYADFQHFPHGGGSRLARDESAIGTVGVVTVATRGTNGPGEVLIRIRGGSETYLAWSENPLSKGATVLVIDCRGPRTVDVIAWDDPLGDAPGLPGSTETSRSGE